MLQLNFKRLRASRLETVRHAQTSEAARIDKAQFPARSQLHNGMSVFCDFVVGLADQHPASHSQVNDPLGGRLCPGLRAIGLPQPAGLFAC